MISVKPNQQVYAKATKLVQRKLKLQKGMLLTIWRKAKENTTGVEWQCFRLLQPTICGRTRSLLCT